MPKLTWKNCEVSSRKYEGNNATVYQIVLSNGDGDEAVLEGDRLSLMWLVNKIKGTADAVVS